MADREEKAIGVLELRSVAVGIECVDTMLDTADIFMLAATPICPGKYIAVIGGDVASVTAAMDAGRDKGKEMVTDYVIIPNVHEDVLSAINSTTEVKEIEAVGVIETFSAASAVIAADLAAKAANVKLIEVRLARGLGGKAYVILTGEVADVESATLKGSEYPKEQGLLVKYVVIPSANEGLIDFLL